jgi:glutaredoxin-like protein NrdH
VKEFLSRAGHAFTTRMIDEDDAAYDALIALGYRGVPVTVIGDQKVQGFNPAALTKALAAARDA